MYQDFLVESYTGILQLYITLKISGKQKMKLPVVIISNLKMVGALLLLIFPVVATTIYNK